MADLARLGAHLDGLGRVMLGYSGGIDSTLLAVVGARTLGPDRLLCVIGRSPSLAAAQHATALETARAFAFPLLEIVTEELDDPRYAANSTERCYYCKTELWGRLRTLAGERGFDHVIDGTNADDLAEHRPGLRASAEAGVRSPLAELGWRKGDIRGAARSLGIAGWNAPAAPCLSSRIRYGLHVTPARLRQVEDGEAFLRSLGVSGDLRVRHLGGEARLEVDPAWFSLLDARWDEIVSAFRRLGFGAVTRDPRGYRRGSLLTVLEPV